MIFRATTPTHIYTLPIDTSMLKRIRVTYEQEDRTILEKTETDCELVGSEIRITLTQEETLLFDSDHRVKIQLRVLTNDGKALASEIVRKYARSCLNEEVLA